MEPSGNTIARDDSGLVDAARQGDRRAFQRLVELHQHTAYGVALGILRDPDEARDTCQDAFIRAWSGLPRFDGRARFTTWLHRITVNLCLDRLRRQRPMVSLDEAIEAGDTDARELRTTSLGFDPGAALLDKELRGHILAALDRLSPKHRAVLLLRELEGLSYDEIAETMGCRLGTVMSRLFYARKMVQADLLALGQFPTVALPRCA